VMWSGFFNFLGVLVSSGAVAFGIVSLLPVELILQVGSSAGFAMVFALLIAAIIWNLGTWYFGLPASSSHTLIGSIIGVGVANALLRGRDGTSGVDWSKATEIGYALLLSPLVGFVCAALLLMVLKVIVRNPALYAAPEGNKAPPIWIRGLLILTCTGVSFAHGSNDGQKGMGLIMLILIGTVPTAYALNRSMPDSQIAVFQKASDAASKVIATKSAGHSVIGDPRPAVTQYVSQHQINEGTYPSLAALVKANSTASSSLSTKPPPSPSPSLSSPSAPASSNSAPSSNSSVFKPSFRVSTDNVSRGCPILCASCAQTVGSRDPAPPSSLKPGCRR